MRSADKAWLVWAERITPPGERERTAEFVARGIRRYWLRAIMTQSGAELPPGWTADDLIGPER